MKLVSFTVDGVESYGLWTDAGVIDLGRRLRKRFATLADLVAGDGMAEARRYAADAPDRAHADVWLDKPLKTFGKCFCVGVNYPERNAEYKDGSDGPAYPSLFIRFSESFVGPDHAMVRPPESPQLDYEGEIVLVVGKRGRRIPAANWIDHVFGWTLGNEGTIRDWVRHGKFNVTPGKNWAHSASLGPWISPLADVGSGPFHITTRVNGEVRQSDSTARMTFPFGRVVEYISTFCTLEPGDIIFTGTPAGAGARMEPPQFLKPGDIVEVEAPGLGVLRNTIRDEAVA